MKRTIIIIRDNLDHRALTRIQVGLADHLGRSLFAFVPPSFIKIRKKLDLEIVK